MREKDLHKIIRDNSGNDNTLLTNALMNKHPELTSGGNKPCEQRKTQRWSGKKFFAVFAPLTAAVVLAVALIPTVILNGGSSAMPPDSSGPPSDSSSTPPDSDSDHNSGVASTPPETGSPPETDNDDAQSKKYNRALYPQPNLTFD